MRAVPINHPTLPDGIHLFVNEDNDILAVQFFRGGKWHGSYHMTQSEIATYQEWLRLYAT